MSEKQSKTNNDTGTASSIIDSSRKVFISYSRKDKEFVQALDRALAARNQETWVDLKDIPFTAEWEQEIYAGIESSDAFIFVISPDSLASEVCRKELKHAIDNNKRLVPILRRKVDDKAAPAALAKLNWLFFVNEEDFGNALDDLMNAINTDLKYLREHTDLLVRSKEWVSAGYDKSILLRGNKLLEAEQWLSKAGTEKEPRPTTIQIDYIADSRKDVRRRQRRIVLTSVAAVALVVVIFFLFLSLNNRRKITLSQQLAAVAKSRLKEDPELGLALSLKAVSLARTTEAVDALRQALSERRGQAILRGHDSAVRSAEFSPDDRLVVTGSDDGTARVWDASTGQGLAVLRGHEGVVYSATFSPDGNLIATAGEDQTAKLWNVSDGQIVAELRGHTARVYGAAFSQNGKLVVTASEDGTARVWDVNAKDKYIELKGANCPVRAASFSPDSKLVVIACGNTAQVREAVGGRIVTQVAGHDGDVKSAIFSYDGKLIATASTDRKTKLWEAATGKLIAEMAAEVADVTQASFDHETQRLVTTGSQGIAQINTQLKRFVVGIPPNDPRGDNWTIQTRLEKHNGKVSSAAFSPDDRFVVTTSEDSTAMLWDLYTKSVQSSGPDVVILSGHMGSIVRAAFSHDGKQLVTASEDKTARVWKTSAAGSSTVLVGHTNSITSINISPNGKLVATASADGSADVWEVGAGRRIPLGVPLTKMHDSMVLSAVFSPNGDHVLTGSEDGTAKIWEWSSPEYKSGKRDPLKVFDLNKINEAALKAAVEDLFKGRQPSLTDIPRVTDAVFSLDGRYVVTMSLSKAYVWDINSPGKPLRTLSVSIIPPPVFPSHARAIFTPSGKELILVESDWPIIFDVNTGQQIAQLAGHSSKLTGLALNKEGNLLVTSSLDKTARVWELSSRRQIATLSGHADTVLGAAFSQDGRYVVTASTDRTAKIWEAATGQMLADLRRHTDEVKSANFSPDGKLVVTAGADGKIRVWDASSGQLMYELPGFRDEVWHAVFTPDGNYIVAAGRENEARVYSKAMFGTVEDLISLANTYLMREVEDADLDKYLN